LLSIDLYYQSKEDLNLVSNVQLVFNFILYSSREYKQPCHIRSREIVIISYSLHIRDNIKDIYQSCVKKVEMIAIIILIAGPINSNIKQKNVLFTYKLRKSLSSIYQKA